MQRWCILLFITGMISLAAGCEDSTSESGTINAAGFKSERSPYVFEGKVVDRNAIPVNGADIHILFTMKQIGLPKTSVPSKAMPTTTISFSIPSGSHVSLRVYRLGTRELVATLMDTTLAAGSYSVSANVTALTNGIYIYQLTSDKVFSEHLMVLLNEDLSVLTRSVPLTRTDGYGAFRIPQSIFGLDEEFLTTSESGPTVIAKAVIDSIGFVIYHAGTTQVRWMKIHKDRNMKETFTLQ